MKLKKVKIIIQPLQNIKEEWRRAMQGEIKAIQKKGVIIFPSVEILGKVLTPMRLELLRAIINENPKSIYALAKVVDRDFKNVHSDVKVLEQVGLITLKASGARDSMKPVAKYSGFELDLVA
jgi:predicted transcriptional regulator